MKNNNSYIVFLMNLWKTYSLVKIFKSSNYSLDYKDKIVEVNHDGEEFNI